MRFRTIFRLAAPLMAFALMLGCSDAGTPNDSGGLPTLTEPGFYAMLSARPGSDETSEVTLSLRQAPGSIEVASVQGEVEYDAATLKLAATALPEGIEGDVEEVSPGRVRFVATLLQGAAEPALLELRFEPRDKPTAPVREMFTVRLEEVTGGPDLADLTSTVRSDRLLFVQGR